VRRVDKPLVVGLNLGTNEEVYGDETRLEELRTHGYAGDRSLVCALCYAGRDSSPGGHAPESVWHLEASTNSPTGLAAGRTS
jgi:hypothetical protein